MTHYEERLEKDLNKIRREIKSVAQKIQAALKKAVHALLMGDNDLAYSVMLGDHEINRQVRKIDHMCHTFVALHLPSAGHLRFVSSVLRMDRELERIGDYAVTICKESVQLTEALPPTVSKDVELLAHQSQLVLGQAVKSFDTGSADLARGTMTMAVQVRETFGKVFDDLVVEGADLSPPLKDLFGLLVIFNSLERVADRAKNVCEETVFAVTGQTKEPKRCQILFVDERNDFVGPLAETFARRAFPESGDYTSVGWKPAPSFSDAFTAVVGPNGLEPRSADPVPLDMTEDELGEFHVIVSLQDGIEEHIPVIPFQTILLRWNCEPEGIDQSADPEGYRKEVFQAVAVKIRELMEALRGEEAP